MNVKTTISEIKLILLFFILHNSVYAETKSKDFTKYVNPFIGTTKFGHCSPSSCVPFGLIQAGPETGNFDWEYAAGYQYNDSTVYGFSQTRLNGTGVPDLGDLLILPFNGGIEQEVYYSRINKERENASPGYYTVKLEDSDINVGITASEHVAFYHIAYNSDKEQHLLIDFQSALVNSKNKIFTHVENSEISFESPFIISGHTKTNEWVNRTYYYTIEFNKPFERKTLLPKRNDLEKAPRYILDFNTKSGGDLYIKISLSSTSIEGAKRNLKAEIPEWNFEEIKEDAKDKWNNYLSRIEIEGAEAQKNSFYTSLYHLLIQPNNISDVGEKAFYSTFSLWDTYRAAHPLYTILCPEHVDDFINSMLNQYNYQGFLPIWALWGEETYCMIGNHAVPVIVDAFLKGFKGFDKEKAYEAIKRTLIENHKGSDWEIYDKYGYYPFDLIKTESVSKTLESCYDDYCASLYAKVLGKEKDYEFFKKRSDYYKNLFDPETSLMRGKDSGGKWRIPFNSLELSHASMWGGDYTEGNAWQYTWHIQHDIKGLVDLMGGKEPFITKLDSLFEIENASQNFVSDVTGMKGQYAHGNEPSHHIVYLYTLAGKPWKTEKLVHDICRSMYQDKVDGLCGNDDCGQMSAWYIFSCLGFYPVNPCGGEYVLGAPQIDSACIKLSNGKQFKIEAVNRTDENIYVDHIELNGKRLESNTINHNELIGGGVLRFYMSSFPH